MAPQSMLPHNGNHDLSLQVMHANNELSFVHELSDDELKAAVIKELQVRILAWVEDPSGNSRSLSAFARKAQVTDSTVRRIFSGTGSVPAQDNLMRALVALTGLQNTREVVEYFEGRKSPIYIYLKKNTVYGSFTASQGSGFVMEGVTAPTIPVDDDVYLAHSLIDQENGTRFMDLLQLMGSSATGAVDRLIKAGIAVLSEDGILRRGTVSPIISKNTALNMAKVLISRFTRGESDDSRVTFFSERISEEGLRDLHRVTDEYIKAVTNIVDNKKGNIPIFLFGVLDKMEFKKIPSPNGGGNE